MAINGSLTLESQLQYHEVTRRPDQIRLGCECDTGYRRRGFVGHVNITRSVRFLLCAQPMYVLLAAIAMFLCVMCYVHVCKYVQLSVIFVNWPNNSTPR